MLHLTHRNAEYSALLRNILQTHLSNFSYTRYKLLILWIFIFLVYTILLNTLFLWNYGISFICRYPHKIRVNSIGTYCCINFSFLFDIIYKNETAKQNEEFKKVKWCGFEICVNQEAGLCIQNDKNKEIER